MGIASTTAKRLTSTPDKSVGHGPIMAIGGAEDKVRNKVVLSRFVELAGNDKARIVIVPTASSIETAGERYKGLFLESGVQSADVARINDRDDANGKEAVGLLSQATGIFLTGGNQLRLSALVSGTRAMEAVQNRSRAGAVVAGTSAGASILSTHMVAFGRSGGSPKQRMAQMVAGFGLLTDVIIDQHFRQRDRLGRLLMMVASSPALMGIGIDEDTAAVFSSNDLLGVIGGHGVTIVDGSRAYSDIHEVKGTKGITVSGAILHSLTQGDTFDLHTRALVLDTS